MNIEASSSFFKSLKKIGSFGSRFKEFRYWVKYHFFNKNFKPLLKEVYKTYPWDWTFIYELEKAKIQEMRKYHEKSDRFEGVEYVIRDMKICERLIDIILGKVKLFHYDGDINFIKNEDGNYELKPSDDFKYNCDIKVNTKNWKRFCSNPKLEKFYTEQHPDELYQLKAKYLYHKIRYDNDETWWD